MSARAALKAAVSESDESQLEVEMAYQIRAVSLPVPETQHRFHPTRKFRFDFAWPDRKVALECEGGIWIRGRHTRGTGFISDCTKYSEAALAGWLVLRVTREHIKSGEALRWLEQALKR